MSILIKLVDNGLYGCIAVVVQPDKMFRFHTISEPFESCEDNSFQLDLSIGLYILCLLAVIIILNIRLQLD